MFTWSDEDTLHSIAYGREGFAEQQGRPANDASGLFITYRVEGCWLKFV